MLFESIVTIFIFTIILIFNRSHWPLCINIIIPGNLLKRILISGKTMVCQNDYPMNVICGSTKN
jgi:hypothetical protein